MTDIDTIHKRHVEMRSQTTGKGKGICNYCGDTGSPWPCDTRVVLDACGDTLTEHDFYPDPTLAADLALAEKAKSLLGEAREALVWAHEVNHHEADEDRCESALDLISRIEEALRELRHREATHGDA